MSMNKDQFLKSKLKSTPLASQSSLFFKFSKTNFYSELKETESTVHNGSTSNRNFTKSRQHHLYGSQKNIKNLLSSSKHDKHLNHAGNTSHRRHTSQLYDSSNTASKRNMKSYAVAKLKKSSSNKKTEPQINNKSMISRISELSNMVSSKKMDKGYLNNYSNLLTERTSETNRVRKSRENIFKGSLTYRDRRDNVSRSKNRKNLLYGLQTNHETNFGKKKYSGFEKPNKRTNSSHLTSLGLGSKKLAQLQQENQSTSIYKKNRIKMIKSVGSIQDFLDQSSARSKLNQANSGHKSDRRKFYHAKTKSYVPEVGRSRPLY